MRNAIWVCIAIAMFCVGQGVPQARKPMNTISSGDEMALVRNGVAKLTLDVANLTRMVQQLQAEVHKTNANVPSKDYFVYLDQMVRTAQCRLDDLENLTGKRSFRIARCPAETRQVPTIADLGQ